MPSRKHPGDGSRIVLTSPIGQATTLSLVGAQVLHRRIVEISCDHFAEAAATEPDLLAHHFIQARMTKRPLNGGAKRDSSRCNARRWSRYLPTAAKRMRRHRQRRRDVLRCLVVELRREVRRSAQAAAQSPASPSRAGSHQSVRIVARASQVIDEFSYSRSRRTRPSGIDPC